MGRRLQPDRRLQELETIYREHHRRVRWVLRSRGVTDDVLDDLTQEAFLAIFRRLPERDPALPMGTWIAGVTRNIAFSHRRSSARRLAASRELPEPTTGVELDEAVARRRAWGQLQGFLDGLDADQREVFVLSDLLGMRVPEVAHVVDAPLNTLYSRLRLARRRFNDRFGADPAQRQRAGKGECPSASERRHAWLAIAAKLPLAAPVAAATTGSLGLGWLLAGGLSLAAVVTATVLARSDLDPTTQTSRPPRSADRAPPSNADSGPAPDAAASRPSPSSAPDEPAGQAPPTQEPTPAVQSRPATKPARSAPRTLDPPEAQTLGATVEALRTAQRLVREDRPLDALATLDALTRDHADDAMPRERLHIEREAACAAGLVARAATARDRLRRLGAVVASEPACEEKTSSP